MHGTTDPMETGSVHEVTAPSATMSNHGKPVTTNPPRKRKSLPSSPVALSLDIQEEIDDLYDYVPEVKKLFKVIGKIGEGTFSSVFLAKLNGHPSVKDRFALKHIIPTSHPSRIEQELSCLQEIGDADNVMGVKLCLRNKDHVVIVMQYVAHDKFQDYAQILSLSEVRDYLKNLLISLRRVHEFDIIHRDVKPSNFLYNRKTKQFALVDFGLAHKAPVPLKTKVSDKDPQRRLSAPCLSPTKRQPLTTSAIDQAMNKQCGNSGEPNKLSDSLPGNFSKLQVKSSPLHTTQKQQTGYGTPATPDMSNLRFAKRVKSPRRYLLARRMQQARENEKVVHHGKSVGRSSWSSLKCQCYGKPQICSMCSARSNQNAPRAGTPGFRSPEVLMKCPDQSTAVDIWAAGVIFLSLLSGRYPFFRANDDMTALAQIISIFGCEQVQASAKIYGKTLVCGPSIPALSLRVMCQKLRQPSKVVKTLSSETHPDKENLDANSWKNVPDSAYDLLQRLMDVNPFSRIAADEALLHPFFSDKLVL